jgi:hypothetical protein
MLQIIFVGLILILLGSMGRWNAVYVLLIKLKKNRFIKLCGWREGGDCTLQWKTPLP